MRGNENLTFNEKELLMIVFQILHDSQKSFHQWLNVVHLEFSFARRRLCSQGCFYLNFNFHYITFILHLVCPYPRLDGLGLKCFIFIVNNLILQNESYKLFKILMKTKELSNKIVKFLILDAQGYGIWGGGCICVRFDLEGKVLYQQLPCTIALVSYCQLMQT